MILYSDSLVMHGSCKAVVCSIGKNCYAERLMEGKTFTMGDEMTPLQIKLKDLSDVISNYAILGALVTILLYTVFWLFNIMFGEDTSFVSTDSMLSLL